MKIVENGILKIPLFHGTSSLFLESITKHGLGAINLHEALRTVELMQDLCALAKDESNLPIGEVEFMTMERMSNQEVTAGGFNFRHGGVYFAVDDKKARSYSKNNQYGSELLSYALGLFKAMNEVDPEKVVSIIDKYPEAIDILDQESRPLMVKARNLPVSSLLNETGEDAGFILSLMQEAIDEHGPELGTKLNIHEVFELQGIIPFDKLEILPI
ncbi:hypothetical protein N8574_01855 [Akkermansiaceae bacterium]|nr:hypothetical protein [Akkermansiaceae bacterium]